MRPPVLCTLLLLFSFNSYGQTIQKAFCPNSWNGGGGDGLWTTSSNWDLGVPASDHLVTIDNGDVVTLSATTTTVTDITIDGNSTLIIASTGNLQVDGASNRGIDITSGSTLTNQGILTVSTPTNYGIYVAGTFTNDGTTTVSDCSGANCTGIYWNANSTNNATRSIIISNCDIGMTNVGTSAANAGTITISNSSVVGMDLQQSFTNNGTISVTSSGSGGGTEGGIRSANTFTNGASGSTTITGANPYGYRNGSASGNLSNAGALTIGNSTTYGVDQNGGSFSSSGTLTGDDSFNLTSGATIGGTLNPGSSPGTTTFSGNVSITGTINIELDGATPDTEHDQITVSGNITLTGATIDVTNGYTPSVTTNFVVVTATGSVIGTPTINLPSDGGGITWSSTINAANITITATVTLPVELIGFEAIAKGDDVYVNWQTLTETNNDGFEVQNSRNGTDWTGIGFIKGQGTTSTIQNYSFHHIRPQSGTHYYRLKQVDLNGEFSISNITEVYLNPQESLISLSPNPWSSQSGTPLQIEFEESDAGILRIYKLNGQEVFMQRITDQETAITLPQLAQGIYFVRFNSLDKSHTSKLLIR